MAPEGGSPCINIPRSIPYRDGDLRRWQVQKGAVIAGGCRTLFHLRFRGGDRQAPVRGSDVRDEEGQLAGLMDRS